MSADAVNGFLGQVGPLLPIVGVFVLMYFMLIRPQQKKDKAVKKMRGELKVRDRVSTIGGIYGTVVSIKDETVTIEVGVGQEKSKLVIARWAIGNVEGSDAVDDSLT